MMALDTPPRKKRNTSTAAQYSEAYRDFPQVLVADTNIQQVLFHSDSHGHAAELHKREVWYLFHPCLFEMIQLYAFSILTISTFLLKVVLRRYSLFPSTPTIVMHRDISSVFHLLSPPNSYPKSLLASRASPNARLVRAFSLTNTFVSADIDVHSTFVGHANALLRAATQRGWPYFQHTAIGAIEAVLCEKTQLEFDVLVQDVTLRVILVGFLDVGKEVGEFDCTDIRVVASHITRLWRLSKSSDNIPSHLLPQLNHHLRRLIPDEETYPNPLDYVIPVWETLWRVVATTVAFASTEDFTDIFAELHKQPTVDRFRTCIDIRPSTEAFVTEAMRLHPPSKRIARCVSRTGPFASFFQSFAGKHISPSFSSPMSSLHKECADIESVLRDFNIWGPDALQFDPTRFHPTRLQPRQEKVKVLPFGYGRYRCIAASWAPMAAGVISAAILDRIGAEKEYYLVAGKATGGREGWEGWSILSS